MANKEKYVDFLPDQVIEGKLGFYPALSLAEWRALPLPMKCAKWEPSVKSVIFDAYFSGYGVPARVEVSVEDAFKALFQHNDHDTQLYSVVAVKTRSGKEITARWLQDTTCGAFGIVTVTGDMVGVQGGFSGYIPENCEKELFTGKWTMKNHFYAADGKKLNFCF